MKNILYIIAFMVTFFAPNLQAQVLDASFENLASCNSVGRLTFNNPQSRFSILVRKTDEHIARRAINNTIVPLDKEIPLAPVIRIGKVNNPKYKISLKHLFISGFH
jgi:hypothetical protein